MAKCQNPRDYIYLPIVAPGTSCPKIFFLSTKAEKCKKTKETRKGISRTLEAIKYTTVITMVLKWTQQWALTYPRQSQKQVTGQAKELAHGNKRNRCAAIKLSWEYSQPFSVSGLHVLCEWINWKVLQ